MVCHQYQGIMCVKRMVNKNRALKGLQVVITGNNDFHGVKCLSGEFCCRVNVQFRD